MILSLGTLATQLVTQLVIVICKNQMSWRLEFHERPNESGGRVGVPWSLGRSVEVLNFLEFSLLESSFPCPLISYILLCHVCHCCIFMLLGVSGFLF